jgi:hypothetical protein
MLKKIKAAFTDFLESQKDVPLLVGLVAGLYPFLFYYSNNYPSINSWQHLGVLLLVYVGVPVAATVGAYYFFNSIKKLRPYKKHLLFVMLLFMASVFMSLAMYFTFKKKLLLCVLVVACLASLKLYMQYKRILVIIAVMALLPLFKCAVQVYEDVKPTGWTKHTDGIAGVKFKHRPNVYMIQPDGYASREIMEKEPYAYQNSFYQWLEDSRFTVYKDFRSNYPASLTSNASMFAMKHHYFSDALFPDIEMPNARETIMDNNAVAIFNSNGYATYYIAEDEYFQQNLSEGNYSHYNITTKEIPLFTKGAKLAREVYTDLEKVAGTKTNEPKFVFVEKVLPHHVHFYAPGDRVKAEKEEYLQKTEEANKWLKKTVAMIDAKDKDAVIIILADHGGWVGIENMDEFLRTKDKALIKSTFGNLAAIRWNAPGHEHYDTNLKTNVNVFRVLFAYLAEDSSYLDHLEEDGSYNIRHDSSFFDAVYQLIDDNGNVVYNKHK